MDKMIRISNNLNTFANIARMIARAFAVILAICVVILLFVSPKSDLWRNGTYDLELGNVRLELVSDEAIPVEAARRTTIGGLIFCIPVLLFAAKCLRIVQDILTPMTQGKPFHKEVSTSLRKLSFLALAAGAVIELGRVVISLLRLGNIRLDALFNPELVAGYTVEHVINGNFIFLFAVLHLMSYVFRYGEELQQLSDETL